MWIGPGNGFPGNRCTFHPSRGKPARHQQRHSAFERRVEAWERLSDQLNLDTLSLMTREISLESAIAAATDLMDGKNRGRMIVDVNS